MVRALDQKASQVDFARLRDPELRIAVSRLAPSWSEAKVATDISASLEALLVPQRKDVSQWCDVSDSLTLQQGWCLGILGLGEFEDLPIVVLDLERYLRNLIKHRTERLSQPCRHDCQTALRKTSC